MLDAKLTLRYHVSMSKDNTLEIQFKDTHMLFRAYMPFVTGIGLFIPTDLDFRLGDSVTVSLTLPSLKEPLSLSGKVVWITPKSTEDPNKKPGVGIQFKGVEGKNLRGKIETLLGESLNADDHTTETL